MPFDSAYWPVAGESTFWPRTSAPAPVRLSAARFSFDDVEPRVRPDELHLRARMRRLRAERERVRVADHLRDRERNDVAELAVLRRRARPPCRRGRSCPRPRRSTRRGSSTGRCPSPARRARSGTSPRASCRRSRTTCRRSACSPAGRGSRRSAASCAPFAMFSLYVVWTLLPSAFCTYSRPSSCACDQPWSLCGPDVDPRDLVRRCSSRPIRCRCPTARTTAAAASATRTPTAPNFFFIMLLSTRDDLRSEYKTPLGRGLGHVDIFERIERIAAIGDRPGLLAGRGRSARSGRRLDGRSGARGLARRGGEPARPAGRRAGLDGLAPRLRAERRPLRRRHRRPRGDRGGRAAAGGAARRRRLPRRGDRADGEPPP